MSTEQLEFINALGTVQPFDNDLVYLAREGYGLVAPELVTSRTPGVPGARYRSSYTPPRSVAVTALGRGWSGLGMEELESRLAERFDPDLGPGKLRVTRQSGVVRELRQVYYQGGLEIDTSKEYPTDMLLVIRFLALDPHWWDATEQQVTFALDKPGGITVPLVFPLAINPEGIYTTQTIYNTGTVEAWPRIEITGPGTDPVLENLTTGKKVAVVCTLTAGERLVIETDPDSRQITLVSGGTSSSLIAKRSADSTFPSLKPGANQVRVRLTNASGGSVVKRWNHRYKGI